MPFVHSASMPALADLLTSAADGLAAAPKPADPPTLNLYRTKSSGSDRAPPRMSRPMSSQALGSIERENAVWSLREEKQRLELRVKQHQLHLMQQQLQLLQQAERTAPSDNNKDPPGGRGGRPCGAGHQAGPGGREAAAPSSDNNKDGATGGAPPVLIEASRVRRASMPTLADLPAFYSASMPALGLLTSAAVASAASDCSDRAAPRMGRRNSSQGLGSIESTMVPLHEEKQRLERTLHLLLQQREPPSSDNTQDAGAESQSVKVGKVLRDGTKMLAAAWRRATGPIPLEVEGKDVCVHDGGRCRTAGAPLAHSLEISSSIHWSSSHPNHPGDIFGQMAPPKSGHPLGMPPGSSGMLRGCPLLGGAICPNVVSRVEGAPLAPAGNRFLEISSSIYWSETS